MYKLLIPLGAALLLTGAGHAQNRPVEFQKYLKANDTTAMRTMLAQWQQQEPQSPDVYVARFNYLLSRAEHIEIRMGGNATGPLKMVAEDKQGRVVGGIGSAYDPKLLGQAQAVLREGIKLAPNRLDMRYGLAKSYEEGRDPASEVAVLKEALADHARSGQPWQWFHKDLPAPEAEFVPATLEQYATFYLQQDGDAPLETARQLAELIEQYYPASSLGHFNLGVYYSFKGQRERAYAYLQKADALHPDDLSTVANLVKLAIDLKRKPEAEQYLARLRKLPDSKEAVADLSQQLRKLK
ncbi:hypothetical protein LJY25_16195 [Hymenobacter sp. BT175]|uniref:tetratricopeptide repeat protein n=1 Tax=Hymenobacter translucens TaxID=2886507 RepID=UPI001D0E6C94|nr:tetratricopeptide repeat protein [Hymenobacter translucens]MCC2547991.1 hypothetical protein [Hymenobacter translucens]